MEGGWAVNSVLETLSLQPEGLFHSVSISRWDIVSLQGCLSTYPGLITFSFQKFTISKKKTDGPLLFQF